jgi:hypothetical protein
VNTIFRYPIDFQLAAKHCWKSFPYSWFYVRHLQDATVVTGQMMIAFQVSTPQNILLHCPHVYEEHDASIFRVAATIRLSEITLVSQHPMAEALERITFAIQNPPLVWDKSCPLSTLTSSPNLTQTFLYK